MQINRAIIDAAIAGFEQQKRHIDETLAGLRAQLNGYTAKATERIAKVAETAPARRKHTISAAGRARMAAAQKKRWAERKKQGSEPTAEPVPKRKMSPAARAKLAANLAKARAAKAAKKAKAA